MNETEARQCAADKSRLITGAVYRVARLQTGEWYVYRGIPGIGHNSPIASYQDGKEIGVRASYSGTLPVAVVADSLLRDTSTREDIYNAWKNGRGR